MTPVPGRVKRTVAILSEHGHTACGVLRWTGARSGARKTGVRDMKTLITAALLVLLASPVLAFHCPADMAAIDAALPAAKLSAEDLARVKELRAVGEAEHAAGNHQASVDALAEAMKLLGI